VDASGSVYVADTGNHRIQKFDSSGTFVIKWGTYGSGNGQFNKPVGIAVDASGYVYVADNDNYRIQKFAKDSDDDGIFDPDDNCHPYFQFGHVNNFVSAREGCEYLLSSFHT
jgi:DNA-binding beta-propeller fold protein YncE